MTSGKTPDGEPGDQDETRSAPAGEAETFGSGRYLVRWLIGEGAQKTVYLVHDTALERDCALSLLKAEVLQGDELARLRREAQTMAGLTHGNIVGVYDISDEAEERPYLVSEYVPGGDLRQELLEAEGPLQLRRAVAIAKDLCRALSAAHRRKVIHRDLKPANIWLAEDGSAKLGDFGIAHSIDRSRLTMPGTLLGTATYMAPEQAEGRGVTERSDLYALGCVLYELLTGRPPFEGDDPMAVVSQHVHAQPSPPSEHGTGLPEALERLVLRLLAKEPEARPASADEVLAELERIEVALPATETVRPARDVARRLKRLWALGAFRVVAAAVLLLAAIGGGVVGAVVLSAGGGGVSAGVEIAFQVDLQTTGEFEVRGDCVSEDLVVAGGSNRGEVTGDITGVVEPATGPTTLYAADDLDERCQSGYGDWTHTFTDEDGNTLRYTLQGPISLTMSPGGEAVAQVGSSVLRIIDGTGIYEEASGTGTCDWVSVGPVGIQEPGPAGAFRAELDCTLRMRTAVVVGDTEAPLVAQLAAAPSEVGVFGSSRASTVAVAVLYGNNGDETERGLSLKLPEPEGARIQTAARETEEEPIAGERVWPLPDLPPGAIARFEFTLQFLSAKASNAPLVVEIGGEGFEEPVRSEPVILNVLQ